MGIFLRFFILCIFPLQSLGFNSWVWISGKGDVGLTVSGGL